MDIVYLDNAATTKPLDIICKSAGEYIGENWFNPSALYTPACNMAREVLSAKQTLLKAFGSGEHNVFFTASGTEGDDTVIYGGAKRRKSMHFVTDAGEHSAVYESFMRLKESGCEVTFVDIDENGRVSPEKIEAALQENTVLVSVMHVNNETGAINDIEKIARLVKNKNKDIMFHADGVQAFMRVPLSDKSNIDYYTVSAHKIHAVKGTGAVFYKKGTPIRPYLTGGGQEGGLRSGTENTFGIKAFAMATEYFMQNKKEFAGKLSELKQRFLQGIGDISDVRIISPDDGANHIVSITIKDVRGEVLLHSLENDKIYISTGSACSSKKGVSRTAKSLGLDRQGAEGVVRISFSPFNTFEEVDKACEKIKEYTAMLRQFTRK